ATVTHLVALEVTKWLAGHRYPGQRTVLTLDSLDLQGRRHELRRRPQCPACGDSGIVAARARQPVRLTGACKVAGLGGGHRSQSAEQTLERYAHLVSPVTGVIKDIERDARGPALLNAYRSGPNLALTAQGTSGLRGLRRSLRAHSSGKGTTAIEAKTGALAEAVERYSATFHGDEEMVTASMRSLGDQVIDPRDVMLFDELQYADRAVWNAGHGPFQRVPEPFDPDRSIPWTPVWSLRDRRQRYLPTGLLYPGAPAALRTGVGADSNGNAAGTSLVDAVLQGALELVERDSVALWWYNRSPVPEVDLTAFGDPWIAEVQTVYAALGRDVWVLDLTADLGVPAMVAVSRRTDAGPEHILFGCGAHIDPRIALRRALTEINQLLPAVLDGDVGQFDDPDARLWFETATVINQPYLLPDPAQDARKPAHYSWTQNEDILADVEGLVATLAARGLDVLVLDQTRPDIELPVVKVVVPGLRHFWARFAPGRLFDVAVQLGRQHSPTRYADLNPIPFFL
ncbi:MAG: TOMM precursor leader peptide-binding protein, partial [Thermocrispum sp.]